MKITETAETKFGKMFVVELDLEESWEISERARKERVSCEGLIKEALMWVSGKEG